MLGSMEQAAWEHLPVGQEVVSHQSVTPVISYSNASLSGVLTRSVDSIELEGALSRLIRESTRAGDGNGKHGEVIHGVPLREMPEVYAGSSFQQRTAKDRTGPELRIG